MFLAHRNNVLPHAGILFDYVGTHGGCVGAAKYGAVDALREWNAISVLPYVQPRGTAATIRCASYVVYVHFDFLFYDLCTYSVSHPRLQRQLRL